MQKSVSESESESESGNVNKQRDKSKELQSKSFFWKICFSYLQLTMNTTYVRTQDAASVYVDASFNPAGTDLVWDALKSQFDEVNIA